MGGARAEAKRPGSRSSKSPALQTSSRGNQEAVLGLGPGVLGTEGRSLMHPINCPSALLVLIEEPNGPFYHCKDF